MGNSFAIIFWYSLGDWCFFWGNVEKGTQIEVLVDFCMYFIKIFESILTICVFEFVIVFIWLFKCRVLNINPLNCQKGIDCLIPTPSHNPHLSNNRLYSEIFLKSRTNHLRIRHLQRFPCRVKNKKEKQQKPNEFLTKKLFSLLKKKRFSRIFWGKRSLNSVLLFWSNNGKHQQCFLFQILYKNRLWVARNALFVCIFY